MRNPCPTDSSISLDLSKTPLTTPDRQQTHSNSTSTFSNYCPSRVPPLASLVSSDRTTSKSADLKENCVEGYIPMHKVSPTSTILDEEVSTDVGMALLSKLGGGSVISVCWMTLGKVGKLRCTRKQLAHWSLKCVNAMLVLVIHEDCVGFVTSAGLPRYTVKNPKKPAVGVTGPFQMAATSLPIRGDSIQGEPPEPPRRFLMDVWYGSSIPDAAEIEQ
ncbi:unnamed protein product [Dibothriocephalus latus]|uniref:Uncharacterized protein n=1 Tax=Dibothriocephalus latus TaxID=60516 RepID=A0A3P7LE37_DIBLA|nr:unnamed protein product [Dibothriocephalus latus]